MIAVTCWFSFHFSCHFFAGCSFVGGGGGPRLGTEGPWKVLAPAELWCLPVVFVILPLVKHFKQCGSPGARLVKFNFATCPTNDRAQNELRQQSEE